MGCDSLITLALADGIFVVPSYALALLSRISQRLIHTTTTNILRVTAQTVPWTLQALSLVL